MCGILGVASTDYSRKQLIEKMDSALSVLHHRGPDDRGLKLYEVARNGVVGLGHTRLSILDLSAAGRQPMELETGELAITFNGEIYNYKELRGDLRAEGCEFFTETDTEVLLKAFHHWGVACLTKLIGMFSFCAFDKERQRITLVRDAFGIKPLFFTKSAGTLVFASELPALQTLWGGPKRPNLQAAYDYLVHGEYGSGRETFYEGIEQLMPASYVEFDLETSQLSAPVRWWTPKITENKAIEFEDAVTHVREMFLRSVQLHLRSDVPLGAALSGGIDSSAIVCAMRALAPELPINTFSYIAEGNKSEERWVDLINAETGAKDHKVRATHRGLMTDLDALIATQGEPFSTTSIYAQYKVFQLAKQHGITVTLDGQGADELLAGYIGFPGERLLSLAETCQFRRMLKFAMAWSKSAGRSNKLAWLYFGRKTLPDSLYRIARRILGRNETPNWLNMPLFVKAGVLAREKRFKRQARNRGRRVVEQLAYSLWGRGLPALLRHADRNSMAFSIESRVPFLTIELAEYLYSLPEEFLVSPMGETKYVFRKAMQGILPSETLKREDKIGFEVDSTDWAQIYIEELNNTDKRGVSDIINFDALMSKNAVVDDKLYWRILNYTKWHSRFIEGH